MPWDPQRCERPCFPAPRADVLGRRLIAMWNRDERSKPWSRLETSTLVTNGERLADLGAVRRVPGENDADSNTRRGTSIAF